MGVQLYNDAVKLRALEPQDIDLLYQIENDHKLWKVSNTYSPYSKYVLQQYLDNSHLDIYTAKQLRLVIESVDDNEVVGLIDLFDFDPFHLRAGVGIVIKDSHKGKGLAYEAVEVLMQYCKTHLGLHQVYCSILEDNIVSQRLFEKHGFSHMGTKKEWVRVGDEFVDEHFYQFIF